MTAWERFTPPRRSCRGCGAELPDWPVIVACCDACLATLPAELRERYEAATGAAWTAAVDEVRAWLAEHSRSGT